MERSISTVKLYSRVAILLLALLAKLNQVIPDIFISLISISSQSISSLKNDIIDTVDNLNR